MEFDFCRRWTENRNCIFFNGSSIGFSIFSSTSTLCIADTGNVLPPRSCKHWTQPSQRHILVYEGQVVQDTLLQKGYHTRWTGWPGCSFDAEISFVWIDFLRDVDSLPQDLAQEDILPQTVRLILLVQAQIPSKSNCSTRSLDFGIFLFVNLIQWKGRESRACLGSWKEFWEIFSNQSTR